MTIDEHDLENVQTANVSRRDFIASSVAAGLVAATGPSFAATRGVVEKEVTVKTPDGICDAAFIHPADVNRSCCAFKKRVAFIRCS